MFILFNGRVYFLVTISSYPDDRVEVVSGPFDTFEGASVAWDNMVIEERLFMWCCPDSVTI